MYCSSLQNLSPIGRTNFQWLPKKFKLTLAGPLFGLEIKIKLLECWTDLYKILYGTYVLSLKRPFPNLSPIERTDFQYFPHRALFRN